MRLSKLRLRLFGRPARETHLLESRRQSHSTGKATCHVERSAAKSKHLQLSFASLPATKIRAFQTTPLHLWTIGKATCHVERSAAQSKHLQLSLANFPPQKCLFPSCPEISGRPAKPLVMLSEAQRSRNICSCPSRAFHHKNAYFQAAPHLWTTGKATCHVERSEAKSKHLQLSFASFPPQKCLFPSCPASLDDRQSHLSC